MDWGDFLLLLVGGFLTTAGGWLQARSSWDREERRRQADRAAARRTEQRDEIVKLLDAGERWAMNLDVLSLALASGNLDVIQQTDAWKERDEVHRAFQLALITCRVGVTDVAVKKAVAALAEHNSRKTDALQRVSVPAAQGRTVSASDMDVVDRYIDRARELLAEVEKATVDLVRADA